MTKQKMNELRKHMEDIRKKEKEKEALIDQQIGYGPTGIFPRVFLERCTELYKNKLIAFIEHWDDVAHDYLDWLEAEGFSRSESVELLNTALKQANLDLTKFPVCG